MPVEYIPVNDAKQTTEIEVKPKPKIQDLVTVESPGKPVPASYLESPKKKTRKRKNSDASNIQILRGKPDSILIITEKPQAAQKIAQALGPARKYSENGVPFYEVKRNNENILVASAVGHLFNLTYSPGQKGWPVFKLEWVPSYERTQSAFTKKYLDVLKKLSRRAKSYVVATDYDIEGEVIGWNVLRFICKQQTAKRMKYSTLTAKELEKSYENLMPEMDWGQAYAGETRHYLDWLYGVNLSRALISAIKKTGSFKVLSIGRVQGPALKIIVELEREIEKFKSEPYWQVLAIKDKISYKHPKDIFKKEELDEFKNIKEAVAETKKTQESLQPPHPFDLTTLQREAYRHHSINTAQTLQIAQKLYLNGLISYPRTSSQKIPDAIEPKKILKLLEANFPEAAIATRAKPIEGKKEDPAHPSIYTTGEFQELDDQEKKLYELIAKRFIAAFCQDAITANKRIVLTAENGKNFTASALQVLEKGWTQVYPAEMEESTLPDLSGKVKIDEIKFEEKETQPPRRFTPASLVTILEKKSLGTKSTRSTIVETLFQRGYLEGQSIKATPLGKHLIESLEKYSPIIIDENLTRQLEEKMEDIQQKAQSPKVLEEKEKQIIQTVEKEITDISKEFKAHETEIGQELAKGLEGLRQAQNEANTLMPCPTCKKGNLRIIYSKKTRRQFVACSAYPECKQTYSLPPNALIKKADKSCESDGFPKLLAIRKGKRPWEFCFNPECKIEKEKRDTWKKKSEETEE